MDDGNKVAGRGFAVVRNRVVSTEMDVLPIYGDALCTA